MQALKFFVQALGYGDFFEEGLSPSHWQVAYTLVQIGEHAMLITCHSFKERGARNALMLLPDDQKQRGVIAASAGNHALALAYHGSLLGVPVTCVMPTIAPLTKINNCRDFGANVVLHGDHILEAKEHAVELGDEKGLTYINGYDHPHIIAGAGTMATEMLNQVSVQCTAYCLLYLVSPGP